jgi:hypothetical protein
MTVRHIRDANPSNERADDPAIRVVGAEVCARAT